MESKTYFTKLTIIHAALLMGQVIFIAVSFFLINSGSFVLDEGSEDLRGIFIFIVPMIVISAIAAAMIIPKSRLTAMREKSNLREKLNDYLSNTIIKFALMEGPSLFAIVAYLLTGDILFLGLSAVVIVVFILERPSKQRLYMDLALSPEEKNTLDDPNAVI